MLMWSVVVGAALVVLWRCGSGALVPPRLTEPSSWPGWLRSSDPAVAALAVLRLGGLLVAAYLAAVTSVGLVLRTVGAIRLVAVVDRLTVPAVRRILAAGLTGTLTLAGPAGAAQSRTPTTVTATTTPTGNGTEARVTMHRLARPTGPGAPPTMRSLSPAENPAATATDWTVEPGQSFWSIAEAALARSSSQPPPDSVIAPYWLRLIEANRSRLADPANPDLVFPGQVFGLPGM
ncbi:MAG: LysM peptidoglycan-binding domain-containing protein [Acidimicrobiales bacterium]